MPRHLRFQQNIWSTHHVVSRCLQGFSFLTPHINIVEVIKGVFAYALDQYKDHITLQHYAFLSNHFHLLISSKDRIDLAGFMRLFKSKLTREINRIYDWKGSIWEGRYSSEEVLDEESFIDIFKYITKNSVKEGLVSHPSEWMGLHGYHQLVEKKPLRGAYVHRMRLHQEPKLTELEATKHYEVQLLPPPMWESGGLESYYERSAMLCEAAIIEARQGVKGPPMGMQKVLEMPVFKPIKAPVGTRPLCRAKCVHILLEFRKKYYDFKAAFQEVSSKIRKAIRLRLPMPQLIFPEGGVPLFCGRRG
jgi:REP element-mobilizing transposase RayT